MNDRLKQMWHKEFNQRYYNRLKRMEKQKFFEDKRNELELKKPQTSKVLMWTIMGITVAIALAIILYSMRVMEKFGDLSALHTLITVGVGTPITLALEFAIYSLKAFFETKEAEKIKLERDKFTLPLDENPEPLE